MRYFIIEDTRAFQKVKNVCAYSPRSCFVGVDNWFLCSVWCWKLPHAVVRRTSSRGKCRDSCGHVRADWESRGLWGARYYSFSAWRWDLRLYCRRGKLSHGKWCQGKKNALMSKATMCNSRPRYVPKLVFSVSVLLLKNICTYSPCTCFVAAEYCFWFSM